MIEPRWIFAAATLLGASGIWLMLPRGTGRGRVAGGLLAATALGLWGSRALPLGHWLADGVFFLTAGVTVVAAVATITCRKPVYCATWFGMSLLGTAGLLLLAGAQLLAVATVVVYAGAILVSFLFGLMLAQPEGRAVCDRVSWEALVSASTGMVIVGVLSMTLSNVLTQPEPSIAAASEEKLAAGVLAGPHVARVGGQLFGRHLIAVGVAATLLLVAVVGAAVITAEVRKSPTE